MWQNPAEVAKRVIKARDLLPRLSWQAEKTRFVSFYANLTIDETTARTRASVKFR